jgi:hypothetical protein
VQPRFHFPEQASGFRVVAETMHGFRYRQVGQLQSLAPKSQYEAFELGAAVRIEGTGARIFQ